MDCAKYESALADISAFLLLTQTKASESAGVLDAQKYCDECYSKEIASQDALVRARNNFRASVGVDELSAVFLELSTAYNRWKLQLVEQNQSFVALRHARKLLTETVNELDATQDAYDTAVDFVSHAMLHAYDGMTPQELSEYVDGLH